MITPILYKWEASVNCLSFQKFGKAALRTNPTFRGLFKPYVR
jgi:hypothetical protein